MKIAFQLYLICMILLRLPSNAEERSNLIQPLSYIDSLDAKIKASDTLSGDAAIKLHNQRGILLFITGEHEKAISDFDYILNNLQGSSLTDGSAYGLALWGRALGNAFLGKEQELLNDLHLITEFINSYNDCVCGDLLQTVEDCHECFDFYASQFAIDGRSETSRNATYDFVSYHNNNKNNNDYEFCRDTVLNTVSFMKEFIDNFPTYGTKRIIFSFIDELGKEALKCCRGKGFWRNCVQPMVDQMNSWKTLGFIPSKFS